MRRGWGLALLAVLLAACAPAVRVAGPPLAPPVMAEHRITAADGFVLPLRRWAPDDVPKAVVLALHGFNDYGAAFEAPAQAWAARGILTYAYDQRGFGKTAIRSRWAGTAAMVNDLRTAAGLIAARHPGVPFYVLGESMGGAVAVSAFAGPDAPAADGLILAAPAVRGRNAMWPWERALLWLLAHTVPGLQVTGENMATPSDNVEMLRGLGRDPLVIKHTRVEAIWGLVGLMDDALNAAGSLQVPALLLVGATDDLVPARATRDLLNQLPADRLRLARYEAGYHMLLRDLQAQVVIEDVAAWIADPAAPLPSGADARAAAWRAP